MGYYIFEKSKLPKLNKVSTLELVASTWIHCSGEESSSRLHRWSGNQSFHRGSRLHVWRWWQRPNVLLRRKWMQPRNSYDVALVIQFSYSTMELLDTSTPTYKILKPQCVIYLAKNESDSEKKATFFIIYITGISMVRIISTRVSGFRSAMVRAMDFIATWNLYFFIIFAIFWWWFFEVWSTLQMLRNFQNMIK